MSTEVTIVAGGPSLRGFDFTQLTGDIIAINYAAICIPQATYCYFANKSWFDRFEHELRVHRGRKIQGWGDGVEKVAKPWVEVYRFVEGRISMTPRTLCPGANSGYAAVNLAVLLGYKQLTLLGYDFLDSDATANFHDTHTWTNPQPQEWRRTWNKYMVPALAELGIEIKMGAV